MAIYRGSGGAGDATGDATNASQLALAAADEAQASAASAASSATNAANSASAAAADAADAATSETNAAGSAADALASENAAASSASDAADSASAAATSATNAASSASTASTQATNASNSASSASTSATNAANSATSASTSATNASNSASAAATSETNAGNSATAAATSATNAAASASTASTQATNASNSATSAASSATAASSSASSASSSASAASTSATNAASSASAASTSASNAATSETNAASSASSAASSASSAASSAASAAAALDSFDDRYLGSKTSNPTLDNDGNALVTGALYYNSVDGEMRVYDGSQWIAASAASQAILTKYKYVATAGQTSFSGSDANALTLSYTVGSIIVTLNGAVLDAVDYTATTGTIVVLASAASLNDEVGIFAFSTFDVANTYTQAQADAKFVELTGDTMTGDLRLNNGNADGAQLQLASSGYSDWNLDNYSGRLRAYYGSTEYFTINTSGNVGIGTSSPTAKLEVNGAIKANGVTLSGYDVVGGGASQYLSLYANSGGPYIVVRGASNGSQGIEFGTGGAERARIDSSGNLLVGTTSNPTTNRINISWDNSSYGGMRFSSGSATYNQSAIEFYNNSSTRVGYIFANGSSTTYSTSSDYRLKENIAPMTGALETVAQLKPVTYTWKADGSDGQGFIAHELAEVVPDCVTGEKDAVDADGNPVYQGIDTSFLVATLTAAIQELAAASVEQQAIIQTLTSRIEALENQQ